MGKITNTLKTIRSYDLESLKKDIKFWIILGLILLLIILFLTGVIQVAFFAGSQDSSILFTLLNALIFGVYINCLGLFNKGTRKLNYKIIILVVAILIMLTGFGYFDIQLKINLWFFVYTTFSSSSAHGIYFFWLNLYFWTAIYFLSFLIESEDGGL